MCVCVFLDVSVCIVSVFVLVFGSPSAYEFVCLFVFEVCVFVYVV